MTYVSVERSLTVSSMLVEQLVDCEKMAGVAPSASAIASNLVAASTDRNSCTDWDRECVLGERAEDEKADVVEMLDGGVLIGRTQGGC